MNDLPPDAVAILYPVLKIVGGLLVALGGLLGGLWAGFRWLKGQIRETAAEMLAPSSERLAVVEKSVAACHRRMDDFFGARSP